MTDRMDDDGCTTESDTSKMPTRDEVNRAVVRCMDSVFAVGKAKSIQEIVEVAPEADKAANNIVALLDRIPWEER